MTAEWPRRLMDSSEPTEDIPVQLMLMFILFKSNLNNLLNLDSNRICFKPPALKDTQVKEGFSIGFSIFWLIMEIHLALLFPLCGQR